jgi:hypothetical protein
MRTMCPPNPIIRNFIILTIFAEDTNYKVPLYALFSGPLSFLRPKIHLSTLFSNMLNICSSLCEGQSFTPIHEVGKQSGKIFLSYASQSRLVEKINRMSRSIYLLLFECYYTACFHEGYYDCLSR